jgi:hypothetical protein
MHLALFSAPSLLSFRITTVGKEGLVRTANCGSWAIDPGVSNFSGGVGGALCPQGGELRTNQTVRTELSK